MLERLAARLLTGPFAFLLAGVIDVTLFLLAVAVHQLRTRARAAWSAH